MAKSLKEKKENGDKSPAPVNQPAAKVPYEPTDLVIKEMMHQKGVSYDDAKKMLIEAHK